MNITVVGSGGWGTALALVLLENGHDVTLWSYTEAESAVLRERRENPMLKGVPLPEGLKLASDPACASGCGAVVLATPSFAVRTTARTLAPLLEPGAVLVSVSKGIEKDTSLTLTESIAQEVGEGHPIVALSGPSHAEEVGRGVPTVVVSASKDKAAAELVQDLFMNERFRVYASDDVVGVELGAALKNVLAETDCVTTMVFDEVDTGVSGRAAQKVAEKLAGVARTKQVLCVTHLPQLAAMADTHFSVEKGERDGRTYTRVEQLDRPRRREELARLSGGASTAILLEGAEELLQKAEAWKQTQA